MIARFASSALFPKVSLLAVLFLYASAILPAQRPVSRIPETIDEQDLVTLSGNVPLQAKPQNDRGEAPGSLTMDRMILVLKRSNVQEKSLEAAIQAMHDPRSPQFHQWLTPAQFGKLYGPSDGDLARIEQWLAGSLEFHRISTRHTDHQAEGVNPFSAACAT